MIDSSIFREISRLVPQGHVKRLAQVYEECESSKNLVPGLLGTQTCKLETMGTRDPFDFGFETTSHEVLYQRERDQQSFRATVEAIESAPYPGYWSSEFDLSANAEKHAIGSQPFFCGRPYWESISHPPEKLATNSTEAVPVPLVSPKGVNLSQHAYSVFAFPLADQNRYFSSSKTLHKRLDECDAHLNVSNFPGKALKFSTLEENTNFSGSRYESSIRNSLTVSQSLTLNDVNVATFLDNSIYGRLYVRKSPFTKGCGNLCLFFSFYTRSVGLIDTVGSFSSPFSKAVERDSNKNVAMCWPWESCSASLLAEAFTSLDRMKWTEVQRKLISGSNHIASLSMMSTHFNTVLG
jgi:hypothetical protein